MPADRVFSSESLANKYFNYLLFLVPKQRNTFRQYLYVFALTMVALLARLAVAPLEGGIQYVTFFPAVALSAVIGGLWPGLFSALLGWILATYLFWPPYQVFTFEFQRGMVVSNLVFLFDAILVCSSIEAMHRYYHRFVDVLAERKWIEVTLRENQRDLNRAQEMAHIGSWRLDFTRNALFLSDENHRIYGIPKGEPVTYESLLSAVHPEDREYLDLSWKAAMGGKSFDIEHRLVVDGKVIWVRNRAELELDQQGALLAAFGTTEDVTEKRRVTEILMKREREFRTLAENIPDNIIRCDREGRVLYLNRTLEDAMDRPAAELIGKTAAENFPDGRFASLDKAIRLVGSTGESVDIEQIVPGFDNEPRHHSIRIVAERGADYRTVSVLAVGRDLTEQKKAEEELRLADRRKNEFLAMLAHELRNPLVPIRNAAHVIGRLGLAEPRIKWAQEIIEIHVTHLIRMVDDLLDISRIVRGKITLKSEKIEFAKLAERVFEGVRPFIEEKRQRFIVQLPAEPVWLDADPVRLHQVLFNLLDNAAKYTPEDGRIEFEARVSGQEIEIRVRDNGEGIPRELLNRVFDMFQQGERSPDRFQGGLGIGLTLVHRIAGMHGGRVEALSEGPGHGSTFIVRLPVTLSPSSDISQSI